MDIVLNLKDEGLQELLDTMTEERFADALKNAAERLAIQAHAHVVEEAQMRLRSRRRMYLDNLDFEQMDDGVFAIVVQQPAMWIEHGLPAHEMVDDLLKNGKTSKKDGSRYKVIPFHHDKAPTEQTHAQQSLTATLRAAMQKMKIPWKKIERDEAGVPLGDDGKALHKFDVEPNWRPDARLAPGVAGPQSYREQVNPRPWGQEGPGGRPFLWGVRIYQKILRDRDGNPRINKKGEIMASRSIMTFRTVSSKQKGSGKWVYPGIQGINLLEETYEWARKEWEDKMLPEFLENMGI